MSQSSSGRCGISKSLEYFTQFFIIFFISIAAGLLATIFVIQKKKSLVEVVTITTLTAAGTITTVMII